jgi:hypothetical protein
MSYTAGVILAPSPATTRGQSTKIDVTPDGKKLVYANGRGVFLRGQDGTTAYFGHQKEATVAKVRHRDLFGASDAGIARA